METPEQIAHSMLAYPFKELGRDYRGIDCKGIVIEFLRRRYAICIKDDYSYSTEETLDGFSKNFMRVEKPEECDVARMGERHLGILVGGTILHCNEKRVTRTPLDRIGAIPIEWYRLRGLQ